MSYKQGSFWEVLEKLDATWGKKLLSAREKNFFAEEKKLIVALIRTAVSGSSQLQCFREKNNALMYLML